MENSAGKSVDDTFVLPTRSAELSADLTLSSSGEANLISQATYNRVAELLNTVNSEPFAASAAGRWLASRVEFDGRRLAIWFDAYTPQEFERASIRFRIHHQSDFKYAIRGLHRRGFRNVRLRFVPAEDRQPVPLINSAGDRMAP